MQHLGIVCTFYLHGHQTHTHVHTKLGTIYNMSSDGGGGVGDNTIRRRLRGGSGDPEGEEWILVGALHTLGGLKHEGV